MVNMTPRDGRYNGYTHKETLATGVTSDPIVIPPLPAGAQVRCTVIAGAGTAKIQDTTSPDADVAADTAVWQDWSAGNKTGTYSDVLLRPGTAVRGVSVSGEIAFEIVI